MLVELLLPGQQFTAWGFTKGGQQTGAEVSLVADGVGGVDDADQLRLGDGAGVVDVAGQPVGHVHQPPVEVGRGLVVVAGGLVLARPQLRRASAQLQQGARVPSTSVTRPLLASLGPGPSRRARRR